MANITEEDVYNRNLRVKCRVLVKDGRLNTHAFQCSAKPTGEKLGLHSQGHTRQYRRQRAQCFESWEADGLVVTDLADVRKLS